MLIVLFFFCITLLVSIHKISRVCCITRLTYPGKPSFYRICLSNAQFSVSLDLHIEVPQKAKPSIKQGSYVSISGEGLTKRITSRRNINRQHNPN